MKIAVVGAGISGIVAAFILSRKHEVVLFESENRLGGHTNTFVVKDGSDCGLAIDTGFIVCNAKNYPNFFEFLRQLNVSRQPSDMSFGFSSVEHKLEYVGPKFSDFLKTPENFLRFDFWRLALDQQKFNRAMLSGLAKRSISEIPLNLFCEQLKLSKFFKDCYLDPLIGAIWSSPECEIGDFPALTFAKFFNNHGMLSFSEFPKWETIVGGSHAYLKAFQNLYTGKIILGDPVSGVMRSAEEIGGVSIVTHAGESFTFDKVVLATHADQSLKLLSDATAVEKEILSKWSYSKNNTVLHTDSSLMPPNKKLWAAWNYKKNASSEKLVQITYYMNKLQNLKSNNDYFVTLNQSEKIDPTKILYEIEYTHPIYSVEAVNTQPRLQALSGENHTYFAGAYLGYGFHEDGVNSALAVAKKFGMEL